MTADNSLEPDPSSCTDTLQSCGISEEQEEIKTTTISASNIAVAL